MIQCKLRDYMQYYDKGKMKMINKTGNQIQEKNKTKTSSKLNKKNELLIILLSFAASFTFFFFSPVDIFLGNQKEFVVSFGHVAVPLLITSLISAALLILIQNIFLMIHKKAYIVISRLIFGITLAAYIQSLFLNSKMAAITGDDARYSDNKFTVILNLAIYIVLIILPLILSILAGKFKTNKVLGFGKGMIIPYLSILIFGMQLAGTGSSMLTADFDKYKKTYTSYLSYEPSMSLSQDENIVVFLVDRLDGLWMDTIIDEYPDLNDKFEGFTFYQNNISHNTNTFPSVAQMLTNYRYQGTEWADYVSKAWEGDTVAKNLKENGYRVNLLIDNLTTYSSVAQLDGQCDNILSCSPDDVKFNYAGKGGIVPTMAQISFSKLSPYICKSLVTVGLGANLSSDFVTYSKPMDDMMPMAVGIESDLKYNDYIKTHEFNAGSDTKTFSYIHLNGAHDNSDELTALYDSSIPTDRWSTTRGDFEILFYYFDQMKKLGIYDNSTIIVLGDHGRAPFEIEREGKDGIESAITTALLVKPKNANAEPLKFDRESELSNDFFPASILEYAGIDHEKFGYSFNDIINGGLHPERYFQTYDFGGYGRVIYKTLYKITGDARDFNNWEAQEEHE